MAIFPDALTPVELATFKARIADRVISWSKRREDDLRAGMLPESFADEIDVLIWDLWDVCVVQVGEALARRRKN